MVKKHLAIASALVVGVVVGAAPVGNAVSSGIAQLSGAADAPAPSDGVKRCSGGPQKAAYQQSEEDDSYTAFDTTPGWQTIPSSSMNLTATGEDGDLLRLTFTGRAELGAGDHTDMRLNVNGEIVDITSIDADGTVAHQWCVRAFGRTTVRLQVKPLGEGVSWIILHDPTLDVEVDD